MFRINKQLSILSKSTSLFPFNFQFNQRIGFSMSPISQIKNVTVIGAGLMGSGIAQVSAQAGFKVTLIDAQPQALEKSKVALTKAFTKYIEKTQSSSSSSSSSSPNAKAPTVSDFMDRIQFESQLNSKNLAHTDVVIEAVVEQFELKKKIFQQLETQAPNHTLLVSNTSSLSIHQLASTLTSDYKQTLVAGLHFFNPVPQMKLVEVIATPKTDPLVMDILMAFCKALGKVPVKCKDTPGFIVNRLLVPYMMEAIRLAERGDASIQDIDTAMKLGAGYPMGPFELADFVGLDTLQFILKGWYEQGEGLKGQDLVKPSALLTQLVQQGKLGRKSGFGFYEYAKKEKSKI